MINKKHDLNAQININLNADYYTTDVFCMSLKPYIEKAIEDYKRCNPQSDISLEGLEYKHRVFSMNKPAVNIISERKAKELYPENIEKKKDKSKALVKAYLQGVSDTQDLISKYYQEGILPEDLF